MSVVAPTHPLYEVDGVLMGEFYPPDDDAPFEHQMVCFMLPQWQKIVTTDGPIVSP